jgi:hypothetical protein
MRERQYNPNVHDWTQTDDEPLPSVIHASPVVLKLKCQQGSGALPPHLVLRQIENVVSVGNEGAVGAIAEHIELDVEQARVLRDWLDAFIQRCRDHSS